MIQPEGFDDGSGRVCLLKRCIYGLKQSGREWYLCLLVKDEVLLFIYVDDILVMPKVK